MTFKRRPVPRIYKMKRKTALDFRCYVRLEEISEESVDTSGVNLMTVTFCQFTFINLCLDCCFEITVTGQQVMGKFGRREGNEKMKSKLRHGSMGVVVFDLQEIYRKVDSFVVSLTNAAASLANWSLKEDNLAIQDACIRMYEISCLISTIIESYSKEYLKMGNSLKELLRQELDLSNLNKKVCQSKGKFDKLKRQNMERQRKDDSSKRLSFLQDLGNAELEYEELKASFDVQSTRHEILKSKYLRDAISQLADGTTMLATRLSTIGQAQKELANAIPVVPTQMSKDSQYEGHHYLDEIVQKTADALKIPRPAPFCEQQISNLQPRKMNLAACFTPDPSSPLDKDWVSVELLSSPNDVVKDPRRWRNQQGQFDLPMLSSLKNRLGIEGPHGRSYISNLGIEQRQALKSRGLHSNATADKIAAPATPPPRTPGKAQAPIDVPRVEPYAVGRVRKNTEGLYASADLLASESIRRVRSWSGSDSWQNSDNINIFEGRLGPTERRRRSLGDKNKEVVYAVLEREDGEKSNDSHYLDVLK